MIMITTKGLLKGLGVIWGITYLSFSFIQGTFNLMSLPIDKRTDFIELLIVIPICIVALIAWGSPDEDED